MNEFISGHPVLFWSVVVTAGVFLVGGLAIKWSRRDLRESADLMRRRNDSTLAALYLVLVIGLGLIGMLIGALLPSANLDISMRVGAGAGLFIGIILFGRFLRRSRTGRSTETR